MLPTMKSDSGGVVLALAPVWLLLGLANSISIHSWLVEALGAPQIVMYDDDTGNIFYSLCNSSGTPVFPADSSAAFNLKYPPLNGTGLAGFGYSDGTNVVAQMFYQTAGGAIVDASFNCDSTTGHYTPTDRQWVVSTGLANLPAIRTPSSINVLPIGDTAGQRIYFRDEDSNPAVLGYHPDLEKWRFDGYVLQANQSLSSGSIGAAILGTQNITLALSIDKDIGISRLGDSTWELTALPTPILAVPKNSSAESEPILPTNETDSGSWTLVYNETGGQDWSLDAFDSSAVNLELAFSSVGTLGVFYIGNNGVLHQISQRLGDSGKWNKTEQQGPGQWPVADVLSSKFALTFDFSSDRIWIYYMSGGSMIQVHQSSSGVWEHASTLQKSNNNGTSSTESSGEGSDGDNQGSDGTAKTSSVGIAVGVTVGVLALVGIMGLMYWYFRRRAARNSIAELSGSVEGTNISPVQQVEERGASHEQPREQSHYPQEKHGEELFELPLQGQRHEMDSGQVSELPHHEVYEMPGGTFLRPQT